MIVFDLHCDSDHAFEGWFASSDAFEKQQASGMLECPMCGTPSVTRLPSAPRLNLGASAPSTALPSADPPQSGEAADRARLIAAQTAFYRHLKQMLEQSDNVGSRFAEEARRIHYKEAPERQIHGSATREETVDLLEEGIPVLPVPFDIKDDEDLN